MKTWRKQSTNRAVLALASSVLAACGSVRQLPPEEAAKYAVVYAKESSASAVTALDGRRVHALSGAPVNVPPGLHRIEATTCPGGSTVGCSARIYELELEAGRAYFIRDAHLVEVYSRFDPRSAKIDSLIWNGTRFRSDAQREGDDDARRIAEEVSSAARLRERTRNLPRVRKVGARICQSGSDEFTRVGYVEGITDEKIQIRIGEVFLTAAPRRRVRSAAPTILWDRPLNWDLCE